jgi:hypothetical protein
LLMAHLYLLSADVMSRMVSASAITSLSMCTLHLRLGGLPLHLH